MRAQLEAKMGEFERRYGSQLGENERVCVHSAMRRWKKVCCRCWWGSIGAQKYFEGESVGERRNNHSLLFFINRSNETPQEATSSKLALKSQFHKGALFETYLSSMRSAKEACPAFIPSLLCMDNLEIAIKDLLEVFMGYVMFDSLPSELLREIRDSVCGESVSRSNRIAIKQ